MESYRKYLTLHYLRDRLNEYLMAISGDIYENGEEKPEVSVETYREGFNE